MQHPVGAAKFLNLPEKNLHFLNLPFYETGFIKKNDPSEVDFNITTGLIKKIKPHILVKGGDYSLNNIVGSEFVQKNGGEVKVVNLLQGYSSSSLIDKFES